MAVNLYDLSARVRGILDLAVDDETGEVDEHALSMLASAEADRDARACAVAKHVLEIEAEAEAVRAAASRLSERARRLARRADRLRDYIGECLPAGTKASDEHVAISWRRSRAVEVEDLDALPAEYVETLRKPDRRGIADAIKAGAEVPGAVMVERIRVQLR